MSLDANPLVERRSALWLRLERFNQAFGTLASWLTLATVLICFATVYLRYVFGVGLIWLQEAYIWTHAGAILLGSGFAFLSGSFISVDLVHRKLSEKARSLVTLLGSLFFLAPFLWFMGHTSWKFFLSSYQMNERSAYEGGLPATYVLKGMLLVFVLLLAIQGLVQISEAVARLKTKPVDQEGR
jgi:TRAP-type mannitol/chloroaromatic compound transport system permease small subunit